MVVGEADTAEWAVIKARQLQPDVVVLDLLLPRKSGYDAIPELVEVAPRAKVLAVSSLADASSVRRALVAGASGYLPKRVSDRQLVEAINLVAGGARLCGARARCTARYSERLAGARSSVGARARGRPAPGPRLHKPGDRTKAFYLCPHGRHASFPPHAEAAPRYARGARDVCTRERRDRPREPLKRRTFPAFRAATHIAGSRSCGFDACDPQTGRCNARPRRAISMGGSCPQRGSRAVPRRSSTMRWR